MLPPTNRLELPILQELLATGGADGVRFLYDRLVVYFPGIGETELANGGHKRWKLHVQRAGRELDENGLITRSLGIWTLTARGRAQIERESVGFNWPKADETQSSAEISHRDAQTTLAEIGRMLGYHAELEFEYYDVVWRTNQRSPRLSHVFEVQRRGNLDSAFAKLKKAYERERSEIFLILTTERDTTRANRSIAHETSGAFHELGDALTILSFAQLEHLHRSLQSISGILPKLLQK